MRVGQQYTEPWGIITALFLGGLGGAVTAALGPAALLGVPVGLGIAGIVYVAKVGVGALTERPTGPVVEPPPGAVRLPAPPRGSPADGWLRRAQAAVQALHQQTESPPDPVLRGQVADVDDRAATIVADLRRVAGHVTLVDAAASRIDAVRLVGERQALDRSIHGLPPGELRDERERALRAVVEQLEIRQRLIATQDTLLARMQSTVLGLEGLVARLAELLTLALTSDNATGAGTRLGELTDNLEGMRAGLAETEELSRRVLSGGSA